MVSFTKVLCVLAGISTCAAFSFQGTKVLGVHGLPSASMRMAVTLTGDAAPKIEYRDTDFPWDPVEVMNTPGIKEHSLPESEYLIEEILVENNEQASELADRCMLEIKRLMCSTEGWTEELNQDGIRVESKPVHGPYEKSGVYVVRGVGEINASAEKFYNFQISREGFQSIDEYLVDHRNVDNYEWVTRPELKNQEDYELMMNRVEWKYPIKRREFVALDIVDKKEMTLISKSALHRDRPGGSLYQDVLEKDERKLVRAVQYYASKVVPIDENRCRLHMVTWGEMCDNYSPFVVNLFNCHLFITPKFDRFRRVMAGETIFEESNIIHNAWQLMKIIPTLSPERMAAKGADFFKSNKRA